jgi:hypothetical protein
VSALAHLKQDSPFFELFPYGIPIQSAEAMEIQARGLVFFVDWPALTDDQKIDLAEIVTERRGTSGAFLKHMHEGGQLPLPVNETDGVILPRSAA